MSDEEAFAQLKERGQKINVEIVFIEVAEDDGSLFFEYMDFGKSRNKRINDVRYLAKSYLQLIESGWDSTYLFASLITENEIPINDWVIEPEWQTAYLDGDLTRNGVADKAVDSIYWTEN